MLLLDEPTAGVDVRSRGLFWEAIQDEAARGVTVFVTTHFLEEVDYCDWVSLIDAGRLIADASPEELRRRFSDGYRIAIAAAPAERDRVLERLGPLAAAATPTPDGRRPDGPRARRRVLDRLGAPARRPADRRPHHRAADDRGVPARPRAGAGGAMSRRRLWTLVRREVRATFRDPFTVGILIGVPLIALLAFSFVISSEVHGLRLAVLDADRSPESRRLVADIGATGWFEIEPVGHARGDRAPAARRRAGRGAGHPARLLARAAAGSDAARGAAGLRRRRDRAGRQRRGRAARARRRQRGAAGAGRVGAGRASRVATGVLFNPRLDGTPFMVAGTFGFVLSFLTTLITAVTIVNERLSGTFDQLQVTPATSLEILLGKLLPLGAVFALDVVIMMLVAGFLFGVWPAGSALFFFAVSTFYVLMSLALGLIFSATSQHRGRGGAEDRPVQHPADPAERLRLPGAQHADRGAVDHPALPRDALHPREPGHLPARRGAARRSCRSCSCWRSSASCCSSWRGARSRRAHDRAAAPQRLEHPRGGLPRGPRAPTRQGLPRHGRLPAHHDAAALRRRALLHARRTSRGPCSTAAAAPPSRRLVEDVRATGYFLPPVAVRSYAEGRDAAAPRRRARAPRRPAGLPARHRARPAAGAAAGGRQRSGDGGAPAGLREPGGGDASRPGARRRGRARRAPPRARSTCGSASGSTPTLRDRDFFLAILAGMLLTNLCLSISALNIVGERESGTFEQTLSLPTSTLEIVLGKLLPLVVVSYVLLLAVAILGSGARLRALAAGQLARPRRW